MDSTAATPLFHASNVLGSPASSLAGAAAVLSVVGQSLTNGWPTNVAGWVTVIVSVATGVGALFTRA